MRSLFGMNFKDMWELNTPGTQDWQDMVDNGYVEPRIKLPLSGYRFFWALFMGIISGLTVLMWRFGLFRALQ